MNTSISDLFDTSTPGIGFECAENNYIINECIVLDMLGGDTKKLNNLYESVGAYANRDGILAETADPQVECGDITAPEAAAILAVAKESGSKDFELYNKAIMLMHETMNRMKCQYGNIANERLNAQKAAVMNNARIMSAVDECNGNC